MKTYNEIISRSLIDFEEIKFVLANNNIDLINSNQIKERYFLKEGISFKSASYKKILENTYIIIEIDNKKYLEYRSKVGYTTNISKIEILDEGECIDFLHHIGYKEAFTIEKNVYEYSNGLNLMKVIDLINIGLYLSIEKQDATIEELKDILVSFNVPFNENECNEMIEKLFIGRVRRYLK